MQVTLQRVHGATFVARGESNHWIVIDTKPEFGGQAAAASPMELVLCALGGCSAIDVETILQKMHLHADRFQVDISAERRTEHPKTFAAIHLIYSFWGNELPLASLQKAVQLSQEKYCSVSAILKASAELTYEIRLNPTPLSE